MASNAGVVAQRIRAFANDALSPKAQGEAIARFAREKLHETDEHNRRVLGYVPRHTVTVDARAGAPLETVKPQGGAIVFRFDVDVRPIIVREALAALRAASPVVSGAYRDNHTIYINGLPVEGLPKNLKATDEIAISNPVPYARRLEIGKTKAGRDFVLQVPNRIYERVAKGKLLARFRGSAKITFGYWTLPSSHVVKGKLGSHYGIAGGKMRKRRQVVGANVQAPVIYIEAMV